MRTMVMTILAAGLFGCATTTPAKWAAVEMTQKLNDGRTVSCVLVGASTTAAGLSCDFDGAEVAPVPEVKAKP